MDFGSEILHLVEIGSEDRTIFYYKWHWDTSKLDGDFCWFQPIDRMQVCRVFLQEKMIDTVDGWNPAPPGMYESL